VNPTIAKPGSIGETIRLLAEADYVAERPLATVLFLSLAMDKPLFLEGEPGVGKTELALVLAKSLNRELIRLQCYEGVDAASALYEWNYPKQILRIKLEELKEECRTDMEPLIFSEEFLLDRPLLKALRTTPAPVLLIDELDRADEEFEAFLLEILSQWQITIPELGLIKAQEPPLVIVTSNRTREIHDALKRRCLYHWIGYPDFEKELAVVRARMPGLEEELARQAVHFLQELRGLDLIKKPGLSETLDWAQSLIALNASVLDREQIETTLGCILKYREDSDLMRETMGQTGFGERFLLKTGTGC
jgi:MoxR-like ATPase